jgi:hypothetical protein
VVDEQIHTLTSHSVPDQSRHSLLSRGWWHPWVRHTAAILWMVALALAVLGPALAHGPFIGAFDWLSKYGLSAHPGVVLHNRTNGDQIDTMMPWMNLAWTQVHHGELPLWNPYGGLGMPLMFNWQSAPFSVPSLFGYLVPLRYAYDVALLVTLVIAGTGAYVLGRVLKLGMLACVAAGTMFELSGPLVGWIGWPHASVMSWAGWVFAAALLVVDGQRRARNVAFLAITLALTLYAGQPEIAIMLMLALAVFLGILLVIRGAHSKAVLRPIVDLVLAAIAGAALAAPLVLPAVQVTELSVRNSIGRGQALPVRDMMHVISQGFNGLPFVGDRVFGDPMFFSEAAAYVGVIAVVLAVMAAGMRWRRPEVAALAAVVVVMAAIVFVPPVASFMNALPGVGNVLWQRTLLPFAFACAILAGIGTDILVRDPGSQAVRRWLGAAFAAAGAILVAVFLLGRGRVPRLEAADRARSLVWPFVQTATGLIVVGVLAMLYRRRDHRREADATLGEVEMDMANGALDVVPTPNDSNSSMVTTATVVPGGSRDDARKLSLRLGAGRWAAVALLACETAFLITSGAPWFSSGSHSLTPTPAEVTLRQAVGSATVGVGAGGCGTLGILPDVNVAYRIHELDLYDPVIPSAYFQTLQSLTGQVGGLSEFLSEFCPQVKTVSVARRFGVAFVLEPRGVPGPVGAVFDRRIGNEDLYRVPGAGAATVTPEPKATGEPAPDAVGIPVPVVHPDPASWRVETSSIVPQVLRLRLTDVPGWHATIDGRSVPLERYSGIMLQVRVPAGRHLVELHYWPTSFSLGLFIAACSAIALTSAMVVGRLVHRRKPDSE